MRKPLSVAAMLLAGAVLAGCSPAEAGAPTGEADQTVVVDPAGEAEPSAVGYDPTAVVDIQVGLEPTSLDLTTTSGAALQQLMRGNVYEGLVGRTETGEITPALATEWTVSADGLVYTFTLRDDVVFHDGTPFTAGDVVHSLGLSTAEGSVNPDAKRMTAVASVEASGEDTIVITLGTRDINFLDALTSSAGMIVSATSPVDLAAEANGTGPYTVTRWNKGSTLTIEPFADYWGEAPLNGGVVYHYITEPATAATALQGGEIDLITGANAETTELFADDQEFTVTEGDSTSWMVLGMNSAEGPLADRRVRQALRQGIDKDGLIEVIGGQALRVGTITVPSDPWHVDMTGFAEYDPEAATALLEQAGYADLSLTLTVANTYDTLITEYIAAQLAEIGVEVRIESVEFATWLENVFTQKQYELTMVLHVDPQLITYYGNPDYYWNYDNPEVTDLVAAASAAATTVERDENLREVARLLAEDSASDWLYSPQTVLISRAGVSGYPSNRIANHFLVSTITVTE